MLTYSEEGNRTYVIGCDTVSTPEGFKTTFKVASEKVFASFCKRMKDQADAAKTTQKTDEQQQHDAADETKGTQDDTEVSYQMQQLSCRDIRLT